MPLEFLLGLGLAFLFLDEFQGKRIFHTINLIPMMIVPAITGYMFFMLFQTNGPVNAILSIVSGKAVAIPWLSTEAPAVISVIIAEVWQWTPLMFLILLSGLMGMPEDQMRAAAMLGRQLLAAFPLPDAADAQADHRHCAGHPLHGSGQDLRCDLPDDGWRTRQRPPRRSPSTCTRPPS